jgi:superfamily II DNA/RNA helicase
LDLLIATDCISEGQNLQDCDYLINYDIHWNPVRIIQRFGRIDRLGSPNTEVKGINFWIGKSYEESINLKKRVEKRRAIMALAGTETIDKLTNEMQEIMTDNPLISEQEQKMLEQMQNSWEDIEVNDKNLSMADFSLQMFREELWDYMNKQKEKLKNMPNGVFSGFLYDNQKNIKNIKNKNIIALLKHKKDQHFLLLFTNQNGENVFVNDFNILSFLKENKKQERKIKVDMDDNALLKAFADMLGKNIENQAEKEAIKIIDDIFNGNFDVQKENKKELTEDYFKRENFDIITWEIIQTINH